MSSDIGLKVPSTLITEDVLDDWLSSSETRIVHVDNEEKEDESIETSYTLSDNLPSNLSVTEKLNILTAKRMLADVEKEKGIHVGFSDMAILRFIRGRNGDLEKAVKAMQRTWQWRLDNLQNLDPASFITETRSGKLFTKGKDLEGRPCLHVLAQKHNRHRRDLDMIKKFLMYTIEDAMKLTKPNEEKLVIIFDLQGFSLNCMDYEVLKMFIQILQYNYPEILSVAYIVNAPFLFSACWLVIKPWLDPVTAAKVRFLLRQELKDFVDASALEIEV